MTVSYTVVISQNIDSLLTKATLRSLLERGSLENIVVVDGSLPKYVKDDVELLQKLKLHIPTNKILDFASFCKFLLWMFWNRTDAVYLSGRRAAIWGSLSAFLAQIPNRVHIRWHGDLHHSSNNFKSVILDKLANKLSTQVIATSQCVLRTLTEKESVARSKVKLVEGAIDTSLLDHLLKPRGEKTFNTSSKIEMLVISRTEDYKRVHSIAKAFQAFFRDYPNSKLTIIGAPSNSEYALQAELSQLPFHAYNRIIDYVDVLPFLVKADVFLHIPYDGCSEAFGLVYLEALYLGVPSIFSRSGVMNDLSSLPHNVLTIKGDKNSEITEAMKFLVSNSIYDSKGFAVVRNEIVSRFSIEVFCDKLLALLVGGKA